MSHYSVLFKYTRAALPTPLCDSVLEVAAEHLHNPEGQSTVDLYEGSAA